MSSRKNFGQLKEVIHPPNLIENQIDSFKEFLQVFFFCFLFSVFLCTWVLFHAFFVEQYSPRPFLFV